MRGTLPVIIMTLIFTIILTGAPVSGQRFISPTGASFMSRLDNEPDLEVTGTDIVFDPAGPIAQGQPVTCTATIHNAGDTEAVNVVVAFYFGDPEVRGKLIPGTTPPNPVTVSSIPAGGSVPVAITGSLPFIRDYDVYVFADPDNLIIEMSEINNKAYGTIFVGPDLTLSPSDITFDPDPATSGTLTSLDIEVRNTGGQEARAPNDKPITVRIYGRDPAEGGRLIRKRQLYDPVPAGGSRTISYSHPAPPDKIFDIYVSVDNPDRVAEFDEGNNMSFNTIVIADTTVYNTWAEGWTGDNYGSGMDGDILVFISDESDVGIDINADGDMDDSLVRYHDFSSGLTYTPADLHGSEAAVSGHLIAYSQEEWQVGADLNDDGDQTDVFINYYDISTGDDTFPGILGSRPCIEGNIIACHTSESYAGDMNDDGDTNDRFIQYYDITTDTLTNTGEMGTQPELGGNLIAFTTSEEMVGTDLNGDSLLHDYVLQCYDITTGITLNTGKLSLSQATDGRYLAYVYSESKHWVNPPVVQDLNDDGDTWDYFIGFYDTAAGTDTETLIDGYDVQMGPGLIGFVTYEGYAGDLNNDGDDDDDIIRYYFIELDRLIALQVNGENMGVQIQENRIAYTAWEVPGHDINDDGDTDDILIQYTNVPTR